MRWVATPPGPDEVYPGNAVEPLIDDALWPPLERAIRESKRSLDISQLLFETGFRPTRRPLADEIADAAARGVRVRLLVNRNAVIPDSVRELVQRFSGTGVEIRWLELAGVLHAKLAIVDDDAAFLIDAPYEQKYADTAAHTFRGERRTRAKPFHTVSARIEGPAVARLADVYARMWSAAGGAAPAAWTPMARGPRRGAQTVQVLCTAPAGALAPHDEAGVLRAYLRAIDAAERFLYLETQYFTSATITDALAVALREKRDLDVILVLNAHVDVPGYETWQRRRLAQLGAPRNPRLGVFSLWTPRRVTRDPVVRMVYVHSKVAIADDRWATIGSANLDGISLETADEFLVPVDRNLEVNIALLDAADDAPATGAVASLRRRLWAEHLGDEVAWETTPPEGWLARWRDVAHENLRRFREGRHDFAGRVLPHEAVDGRGLDGAPSRQATVPRWSPI